MVLVFVACLLATGCTNATVDLVNSLSTSFTNSLTTFKEIPDDLYATCLQFSALTYYTALPIPTEISGAAAQPSPSTGAKPTFQPLDPVVDRGVLARRCMDIRASQNQWATANTLVVNYISALNHLAGGTKTPLTALAIWQRAFRGPGS